MTDVVRGTVLGLDRENGTVRAEIGGVVVPAAPYLGEPPWPLASCWFFNAPAYTSLGPIGNRRVAFADDFNFYTSGTPLIGGTGWSAGGAAGSLSTPNNPTDGNGVLWPVACAATWSTETPFWMSFPAVYRTRVDVRKHPVPRA